MSEMTHTPADVRERLEELLDVLVIAAQRYGAVHGTNYVPCMEGVEMGKARRAVVEFALLLRTPRGEGERVKEPTQAQIDDACMWYRHDFGLLSESERDSVRFEARQWFRAWGKALSNGDDPAALRSDAQEEDRWEDLVFGPIVQAYNEAHAARCDGARGEEV